MKNCSAKIGLRSGWLLFALLTVPYLQIFSSIVLAATSFNVTNLTANNPVTAGYTRFGNIQLNDAGQAVFTGVNPGVTDPEGHPRTDVFFWDGTTLKNITANIPGFVGGGLNLNQSAYSAQFGQAFRSISAGYSGHCGRGRSEATLEFFS